MVYAKALPIEYSLINSTVCKNKVLRSVIDDPDRKIILPGEYEIEIEGIPNELVYTLHEYSQIVEMWNRVNEL